MHTYLKTYVWLLCFLVIFLLSSLHAVNVIAPPNASYGRWHPELFRNSDRLLMMTENDVSEVRNRILQGDPLFAEIYSNSFTNREGGVIGGIYQNAISSTPAGRSEKAVQAKNKAFVALMGIGVDVSGDFYLMSDSEKNLLRDQALSLLATFDESAWQNQSRSIWDMLNALAGGYVNDLQYRSRELICYLQAYDLLRPVGQGRVWEETIARRLIKFASNIYYLANYWGSALAYNNHRIITGSALGMAAVLFGDWGADTNDFNNDDARSYMPLAWAGYGMININHVLFSTQVYADGGYNEGPHYLRYGMVYALPYFKAMKRFGEVFGLSDDGKPEGDWTEDYMTNPNTPYTIRSPWFGLQGDIHPDIWDVLKWIAKIRQPEGRLPGIGSTFNDTYFPETALAGGPYFWPQVSFESSVGDKDILNWSLFSFSDNRADFIAAGNLMQESPPDWEKMQVFPQTGDIVFRSGWGLEDIYMHVYAKPYAYSLTDNDLGVHLQDDNSSFLLGYKKQVLALDAGYISWAEHERVDGAEHHNLILVQNVGPSRSSTTAQIESYQKGGFFNYARIRTGYENVTIRREFLFCDDKYFIIRDRVDGSTNKVYQFLLHGNDTSPVDQAGGVTWQHADASLKALITTIGGRNNLAYYFTDDIHDNGYGPNRVASHKRLAAGTFAQDAQFLSALIPFDNNLSAQPEIVDLVNSGYAGLFIDRTTDMEFGNRYDLILSQWPSTTTLTIPENTYGTNNRTVKTIITDAHLLALSVDQADPDDPNKIKFFSQNMTTLRYGDFILFPQLAPEIQTIDDYTMNEQDTLEITVTATDANGHYLTFSSENLPYFAQLIDQGNGTATIRFTPDYLAAGTYADINVTVTDSGEPPRSDHTMFTLVVQNVNLPPRAVAGSNVSSGLPPMLIFFDGKGCSDLDGSIVSYSWDMDNGQVRTVRDPVLIYQTAGIYHVILTVTDNDGAVDRDTLTLTIHADLSKLFISEVSFADQPYGEFLEIFNNADYDINLREFKLVGMNSREIIKYIFDFGRDEVDPGSDVIIPAKQLLLIGRETSKSLFAEYWDLDEALIHFNSGSAGIIFGFPASRWQFRYFDGTPDLEDGTLIDDTQNLVAGYNLRSSQYAIGQWRSTSYLLATPGALDGDQSLPVELSAFSLQTSTDAIILRWETQSEVNHLGFKILRSTYADSLYQPIASYVDHPRLAGKINSAEGTKYSYIDKDIEVNVTYWYKLVDVDLSGKEKEHGPLSASIISVAHNMFLLDGREIPGSFALHDNFPNPFNHQTNLEIDIPEGTNAEAMITVNVYDVAGKKVIELFEGKLAPGRYQLSWNGKNVHGRDMASGLYILSMQAGDFVAFRKMILLR